MRIKSHHLRKNGNDSRENESPNVDDWKSHQMLMIGRANILNFN
jgi:hypothetical protein